MLAAHFKIFLRYTQSSPSKVLSVGKPISNTDHFELNVGEQDTSDADKNESDYHQRIPVQHVRNHIPAFVHMFRLGCYPQREANSSSLTFPTLSGFVIGSRSLEAAKSDSYRCW